MSGHFRTDQKGYVFRQDLDSENATQLRVLLPDHVQRTSKKLQETTYNWKTGDLRGIFAVRLPGRKQDPEDCRNQQSSENPYQTGAFQQIYNRCPHAGQATIVAALRPLHQTRLEARMKTLDGERELLCMSHVSVLRMFGDWSHNVLDV